MMGLGNPVHLAFVLVVLLLLFGAKRLPEMGRSLGSGLRGFRESINGHDSPEALPERAEAPRSAQEAAHQTAHPTATEAEGAVSHPSSGVRLRS
jgi:sec-independent protein translocase protein TatA